MKRLLALFIALVAMFSAYSQTINLRTTGFAFKEKTYYGWTDWSNWESSNMNITINFDSNLIIVYSPIIQIYKIVEYSRAYVDSDGDEVIELRFVDQDRDRGSMRLIRRKTRTEIYISFNNIQWVYSVVRL